MLESSDSSNYLVSRDGDKMNNNIKIRLSVDNFYDNISKNKQKTKIDPKQLSKSLGYDEKIVLKKKEK